MIRVAGALVIVGTFGALWLIYRPTLPTPTRVAAPEPPVPVLHGARADLRVEGRLPAAARERTATIACDGDRRLATGFWAGREREACDALASTRAALLAGRSCPRTRPSRLRLETRGAFGRREFDVVQVQGGCPDPDAWLAVDALLRPILAPQQKLAPRHLG